MTPWLDDGDVRLYHGDALEVLRGLPDGSVDCCVTSPPYWGLRDYGTGEWEGGDPDCDHKRRNARNDPDRDRRHTDGRNPDTQGLVGVQDAIQFSDVCGKCGARRVDQQLGLEPTPDLFVQNMVAVFREVRRVLADHGTCWVNLGDSYAGSGQAQPQMKDELPPSLVDGPKDGMHGELFTKARTGNMRVPGLKPKDLVGIPWRVAFALQADGWWLRSAITWCKPNAMPESVTDRPTKATEMVFLLTKAPRYYYDAEAIREPHKHDGRAVTTVVGGEGSLQHRNGERWPGTGANARDWWLIATQPFSGRGLFGGDGRIPSPDCPVHGDRAVPAPTARRDGRADAPSTRTPHTDCRPAQESLDEPSPIGPPLELATVLGSSDSTDLSRADAATPHSSGSHRTGRAPATTEPCTPSAQTPAHTGDTSALPESAEPSGRTPESSTEQDGLDGRPSAQTASHSGRKSSCTCHYIDHFATFPEELARRCIVAGCPERVCRVCGKASERIVEREAQPEAYEPRKYDPDDPRFQTKRNLGGRYQAQLDANPLQTVGWSDCGHNAWRPGVTLDPFMGSGTVAKVARDHQRHAIGIDLNQQYLELAARRLQQLSLLNEATA